MIDDQRGFITIAELSVASLIAIPVLASIGGFSLLSLKSERATAARKQTTALERNVLGRIGRELRQARSVGSLCYVTGPCNEIQAQRRDGSYWRIKCAADTTPGHSGEYICRRYDWDSTLGQVNEVTLIEGVRNIDVFTFTGNYIGIKFQVLPRGSRTVITLEDGLVWRNATS